MSRRLGLHWGSLEKGLFFSPKFPLSQDSIRVMALACQLQESQLHAWLLASCVPRMCLSPCANESSPEMPSVEFQVYPRCRPGPYAPPPCHQGFLLEALLFTGPSSKQPLDSCNYSQLEVIALAISEMKDK